LETAIITSISYRNSGGSRLAKELKNVYQAKRLVASELKAKPVLDDITVVIPTLGRAILEESLYWIAEGSVWPVALIVVDQGESSRVAAWIEIMQAIGVSAIHSPSSQRGRAAGVNRGLKQVESPFVAVTDDDCFVEAEWLERMVSQLHDHPEAVVTGRVDPAGEDMIVVVTSPAEAIYRKPRLKFDSLSGGNMGTSMAVINRVGYFDEDPLLRTAEDGEWAYRALKAGVPIIYAPDVAVKHFGWRDETKRGVQYQEYARSHGGFYGKYIRKGDWFIALRALFHHIRALRRWLRGTVTGNEELALYGRAYFTGLLPGIIASMKGDHQS
jgi:GT2 family glycosyltransferase